MWTWDLSGFTFILVLPVLSCNESLAGAQVGGEECGVRLNPIHRQALSLPAARLHLGNESVSPQRTANFQILGD